MILYVLQNAWSRRAKPGQKEWPGAEASWERALWHSHTGKRLREMIPDDADFKVCNASPLVGEHAAAVRRKVEEANYGA